MACDNDNLYIFGGIGNKGYLDTELYCFNSGI
jgi:hypothetical protein